MSKKQPGSPVETIEDLVVVTLDYTLKVDNQVVDTSEEDEPIQFIQGLGQVIGGLERAIHGMRVGERRQIAVSPKDGYGEPDPNAFAEVPRSEFPPEIPLQPGVELQMTDQDGEELEAFIDSVGNDTVKLNFNHPLAGKELHFDVQVVALRSATSEELDHGHVHYEDEHE